MHFDRITSNPTAFIGCLAWIPLAVWIVATVHWMIGDDIDLVTGVASLAVAVGLGYEAINPPVPQLAPLTVIAVLLTVLMFPFVRSAMDRRELRSVEVEALERAYGALGQRPDNVMAKFKIAKHLYDLGVCGHAIRIAEALAPVMTPRFFNEELRTLRRWHMTHVDARYFTPIICSECQTSNEPGLLHCRGCGSPFLLDYVRGRVLGKKLGAKLLSTWIALIAVLIGIPAAGALPPVLSIVVIIFMMFFAIGMVFLAFRNPSAGAAH